MSIISLRMSDELVAETRQRGGQLSEAIRTSLERYFTLLAQARRGLRERKLFTGDELALVVNVCNGIMWDVSVAEDLQSNVRDCESAYYKRWGVDRKALLRKLRGLTPLESMALIDAIERFWLAASSGVPVDARRWLENKDMEPGQ